MAGKNWNVKKSSYLLKFNRLAEFEIFTRRHRKGGYVILSKYSLNEVIGSVGKVLEKQGFGGRGQA